MNTSARDIVTRLEAKYAPPSWAFFTEVHSSVGWSARRADGVAVSLWRSLGLQVLGFEIKVSRRDWLGEIKDGAKSDEIFRYCDGWWIVISNEKIIQEGELPPTWGLMVATQKSFKVAKKAPKLRPRPLDRTFVCELLRRHHQSATLRSKSKIDYFNGYAAGRLAAEPGDVAGRLAAEPGDVKRLREYKESTEKRIEEFRLASGVNIDDWRGSREIGAAVKLVLQHGPDRIRKQLEDAKHRIGYLLKQIDEAMGEKE